MTEFIVHSIPGSPFGRAALATTGREGRLVPPVAGQLALAATSGASSLRPDPGAGA